MEKIALELTERSIYLTETLLHHPDIPFEEILERANSSDVDLSESNFSKYKGVFEEKMRKLKNKLKDTPINPERIIEISEEEVKKYEDAAREMKRGEETAEKTSSKITEMFENIISKTIEFISEIVEETSDDNKWAKSATILSLVLAASYASGMLVGLLLPSAALQFFVKAVILAPIIEEMAKAVSVELEAGKEFFIIFNTVEALSYITLLMKNQGISIARAVGRRVKPLLIHITTQKVQKEFNKDGNKELGFVTGTIIHALWNAFQYSKI